MQGTLRKTLQLCQPKSVHVPYCALLFVFQLFQIFFIRSLQHLQDLLAIFKKFKQHKNVYVSHSYGNIHVLRHLKLLQARHALDSIAGVVMIGLGTNAPVSIGMLGKLPCFVLGEGGREGCVRT